MGWTDPAILVDGDKVSAVTLNRLRDDLRFLRSPPRARAINDSNQAVTQRAKATDPPFLANFGRTLEDTDSIHGTGDAFTDQPPTVGMRIRTAGTYIVTGMIALGNDAGLRTVGLLSREMGSSWPTAMSSMYLCSGSDVAAAGLLREEIPISGLFRANPVDRIWGVGVFIGQPADNVIYMNDYAPILSVCWVGGET